MALRQRPPLDTPKPFFYKAAASCPVQETRFGPPRFVSRGASLWAQVAQLVEQRTENPRVGGSNPPLGTIISMT